MLKNKKIWLIIALILIIVFFRFVNLTANDLSSDDALYSFRALGWFDYLGGGQTTPIQWFNRIPGWANLSFHDGPPLVFAIQYLFFNVLGPSTLAARLPFALAGAGVIILVYFWLKKYKKDENLALLAGFLLAISSYGAWISRIGYLEGVEVFFIVLSIFFFYKYLVNGSKRNLWFWGVAAGLALLAKYTAVFLVPAAVLYLLIWRRPVFKKKEFWAAIILFLIALLPIIIYNAKVFQYRGHFDAALSSMVGMHPEDFKAISGRGVNFNIWQNTASVWSALVQTTSWPLAILIAVALIYLLIKILKKRGDKLEKFLAVNLLLIILLFLFSGTGPRLFSIALPILIIILAIAIIDLFRLIGRQKPILAKPFIIILILIFGGEIFYNFNTNIASKPVGKPPLFYSASRLYSYGFNQLDDYLKKNILTDLPALKRPKLTEMGWNLSELEGKDLIFFDETMSWFALSWYIQKYQFYYNAPLISFYNYLSLIPKGGGAFDLLRQNRLKGFYYIYAADDSVL
ncbi:MAG: glycosyltransferase family 39 protein, partial [Patescibacteria group bacterium]